MTHKPRPSSRPNEGSDYAFLWQLHCLLERDEIEQTWGWDEDWQRTHWQQFVDSGTWRIIQVDEVDIGAIAVEDEPEALRLRFIGLLPEYQGRGIGTGLLKELLARAAIAGIPVKLNVLIVNERAQELYRRLGLTVSGELDGRYVMETAPGMQMPTAQTSNPPGRDTHVPTVQIRKATRNDVDTLARLNQLYRYDLSEFSGQDIGPDAAFDDADLAQYVDSSQYCGHLLWVDDQLAGFGLVNLNSHSIDGEIVKNLDDFFVLRKWRRQGVGSEAARLFLSAYPGLWQVNKRTYNPPAMAFWARVVENVSCGDVREHIAEGDIHMHIFRVAAGQPE